MKPAIALAMPTISQDNNSAQPQKRELPFELDINAVQSWLASLPITNSSESCRIIYSTLRTFNKSQANAALRLWILEKFRPVIFLLSNTLESYFIGAKFPLNKKGLKIAKLSVKLHSELAFGYRLITKNSDFNDDFPPAQQNIVIHRALQSITIQLIRTAQIYEASSATTWQQINELYIIAEANGLTKIPLLDRERGNKKETTIDSLFRTIVLFSYLNPYRFPQDQIWFIFDLLETHVDQTYLANTPTNMTEKTPIFIDLNANTAPQHISFFSEHRLQSCRFLFSRKMFTKLALIAQTYNESASKQISHETIRKIMYLHQLPQESSIPYSSQKNKLIFGPNNIYSFISEPKVEPKPIQSSVDPCNWIEIPDYELMPLNEATSKLEKPGLRAQSNDQSHHSYGSKSSNTTPLLRAEEIWGQPSRCFPTHVEAETCTITPTEEPEILIVKTASHQLKYGELIALDRQDEPLCIGVIRHIRPDPNAENGIYGVEILSSNIVPVKAYIDSKKPLNILFLENVSSEPHDLSILLPPGKYQIGTQLTISKHGETFHYILQKMLEVMPYTCWYSIVLSEEPSISPDFSQHS